MKVDWVRIVRGVALLAWAGFFDWLWLSGRAGDYVGPRTAWVVPFGGIVLTLAALLHLRAVRRSEHARAPSLTESLGLLALLAPLLLVAAAPSSSLGALAVERKRSTGDQLAAVDRLGERATLSLYDIAVASSSVEYAREHGVETGVRVDIDGLVSTTPEGGTFELSRFLASCCAADAMPYSIRVEPPPGAPEPKLSDWHRVAGTLEQRAEGFVLVAETMKKIDRPPNPYEV
jgi:uncharacterized repeat protein (TIGR03943 family)